METRDRGRPPESSRSAMRLGQTIGKYQLRAILGVGGMSTVYAANHRNGLAVAVKVLHTDLANDPSVRRWFHREAYLANRVNHRGAVRVLDDDVTPDGAAYLVIERLYGETVHALWERASRKLSVKEVAVLAYEILDVLGAAHARRIVHRDVKPENLYLTDEGAVKVLDFGIAHPLPVLGEASSMATLRIAGTPAFMAPEQARGVDPRPEADIWAMGATMFALISGEIVHANAPPPDRLVWTATRRARLINEVAHDVPVPVAAVIDRALAFEPEQRFASAAAMRAAIAEAFTVSFNENLAEIRDAVIAQLRARNQDAARPPRDANLYSIATQSPDPPPLPRSGLTDLRAAVTRTQTYFLEPRSWRRHWGWLAAVAFPVAVAIAIVALKTRAARRGAPNAPATPPLESAARYRAGIEAWHDGRRADDDFVQTLAVDPTFSEAHLAYALSHIWPEAADYSHFLDALRSRANLDERGVALLDAYEPSMRVPPDVDETKRRLAPLLLRYADDFRFAYVYGGTLMKLNDGPAMLRLADKMIPHDISAGSMWMIRALGYDLLNDATRAREALEACLANARMPTTCLTLLATLESNEGRCQREEELAQTLLATGEKSPRAFGFLADAVFAQTHDLAGLHEILDRSWRTAQPAASDATRAQQEYASALLGGDFARASEAAQAYETQVSGSESETARMLATEYAITLANELGHTSEALVRATKFASLKHSLDSHPLIDVGVDMDRHIRDGGAIDANEFARRRDEWVRRQAPKFAHRYGSFTFIWIPAYALPARSKEEALFAIAQLPAYLPITDPLNRSSVRDEAIGRVYLLAGLPSEALPFLEKAARACTLVSRPFAYVWAEAELGLSYAALGRHAAACDPLSRVVGMWGRDSRSVTARKASDTMRRLHCN